MLYLHFKLHQFIHFASMITLIIFASILNIFYTTNSANVDFNTAAKHYQQQEYNESKQHFNKINTNDSNLNAKIAFYLGNISFKEGHYLQAIAHYKNSLRFATTQEAKHNLIVARRKLNEMQNPEEKQKSQKQKQLLNEAQQLETQAMQKQNKQNKAGNYIKN